MLAAEPNAATNLHYVTKAEFAEWGSDALTRKWEGDEDDDRDQNMEE